MFVDVSKVESQPMEIEGVSSEVAALIHQYAHSSQTGASLQTLMKTGRGELLHKTHKGEVPAPDSKVATDKILMQVRRTSPVYIFFS